MCDTPVVDGVGVSPGPDEPPPYSHIPRDSPPEEQQPTRNACQVHIDETCLQQFDYFSSFLRCNAQQRLHEGWIGAASTSHSHLEKYSQDTSSLRLFTAMALKNFSLTIA